MTEADIHKLKSGDFICIVDEFGNKRVEIIQEVTDEGIITIGPSHKLPVGKSIEEVELLSILPLMKHYYTSGASYEALL